MKFIQIADVHLGARPDRGRIWSERRTEEIEETFKKVIDICEQEQIDLLLIAGDLFDKTPELKEVKMLDLWLRKLSVTRTCIIAGASDPITAGSGWENYEFESNTVLFPKDTAATLFFADLGITVTGYSYGKSVYKDRILERIKSPANDTFNILLGHGGEPNIMPFAKEKLVRTGFNYYALGGIHNPRHIVKNKMAFPGSLEPINYTELKRHGYLYGEINDGKIKLELKGFAKRAYVNMQVKLNNNFSDGDVQRLVEDKIVETGENNIYRIMLTGLVNSDLEINLSELSKRYCINQIIDKTKSDYDLGELYATNQNNLLGRFIGRIEDAEDDDIKGKALRYGVEAIIKAGE